MSCAYDESLDNIANTKRARRTISHQLKKLLRLFHKRPTYKTYPQPEPQPVINQLEVEDNLANEALEARLLEEMESCDDFSAISVYNQGQTDLLQVFRGQKYIPVHFAKTAAGTFFWTSMVGDDKDLEDETTFISQFQQPQLQVPHDRWAQA